MNFKKLYEEIEQKSGYDKDLVRVVWNSFWYSIRDNTQVNEMIDIDDFGLLHISPKKLETYVTKSKSPREEFITLFEKVKQNKNLTKYLKNESRSDIQ